MNRLSIAQVKPGMRVRVESSRQGDVEGEVKATYRTRGATIVDFVGGGSVYVYTLTPVFEV